MDELPEDKVKVEISGYSEEGEDARCLHSKSCELINEARLSITSALGVTKQMFSLPKLNGGEFSESVPSNLGKALELLDSSLSSLISMESTIKQLTEEDWRSFDLNVEKHEDYEDEDLEDTLMYGDNLETEENEQKHVKQEEQGKELLKNEESVFSCEICDYKTSNNRCLRQHMRSHKSGKYKCDSCEYSCQKPYLMRNHMKKIHQALKVEYICENVNDMIKVYLCSKCSFTSKEQKDIKEHSRTNHLSEKKLKRKVATKGDNDNTATDTDHKIEDDFDNLKEDSENIDPLTQLDEKLKDESVSLSCDRCTYTTSKKIYFEDHVSGSLKYRKCPWCNVHVSMGIKMITRHLRLSHGLSKSGSPFNCLECGEKCKRLSSLELHLSKVHNREHLYHCVLCEYSSPCLKTVKNHVSTHKGPFCCDICGAFLASKASLRNHLEGKHGSKKFQCDLCSFSSTRKFGLTQHMSIHNGAILLCDQCDFSTVHKANFIKHVQRKHSKEPRKETKKDQFPCDMCNAKYSTTLGLKRHKKNHTDPSNIHCTEEGCNYATSRPDNLKHHQQKVHQGVRWPCKQCDYVGSYKSDLNRHVKVTHEGFVLKCDLCKYTTPKKCRLSWHMSKVHQGPGTKWLCDMCEFVAGYEGELNRHIKVVHNGFTLKCEHCEYSTPKKYRLKCHVQKVHQNKVASS